MSIWNKLKGLFAKTQPVTKMFPNWIPVGGGAFAGRSDFYGRAAPSPNDLLAQFDDTVYACATLIANTVASTPIKLFVTTDEGQPRPKCATRAVSQKTINELRTKRLGGSTRVEEVTNHPALELLRRCNSAHNFGELLRMTELYQEIVGDAFWLVKSDGYGIPTGLFLLLPQYMTPIRDEDGFIEGWKYGTGNDTQEYGTDEIIHFKFPNLSDPYGLGYSPLRAAWNRVQIGFKELAYLDSVLSNQGRPDAILTPDEPISPMESERLAKEWQHRFSRSGAGGIYVADGPMKYTPLNYQPRDLAELQLYQSVKTNVCNAFAVPPDIWEMGESNRATAEAALYALAVHCIRPRMHALTEKLNDRLLPMFDKGQGRMFFEAVEIVPEDKAFLLQERQLLLAQCVITRDEARQAYGFAPQEWASQPLMPPGMLPAPVPVSEEDTADAPPPLPVDRSAQAPAFAQLQQAVYAGQLPRSAAIANVVIAFGLDPATAEALFPDEPVKAPGAAPGAGPDAPTDQPPTDPPPPPPTKGVKCGGEGGKPGPCGDGGADQGGGKVGHEAAAAVHEAATEKARSLIGRIKDVPKAIYGKAKDKVQKTYEGLKEKYGKGWAVAIMAAGVVGTATPLPGGGLIAAAPLLACAKLHMSLSASKAIDPSALDSITHDELMKLGKEVMDQLLAEWLKETPEAQQEVAASEAKAYRTKAATFKAADPFVDALQKFFKRQRKEVLSRLPGDNWFDLNSWVNEMYKEMRPMVTLYWDHGAQETVKRIGASLDLLKVTQPRLKEGIDKATLLFCQETNQTTQMELNAALTSLRSELKEGMEAGEVQNQLTARVRGIFDSAETARAYRIAHTEASRGQHASAEIVAQDSGLVKGKRWLASDNACELCLKLNGVEVPLGENFEVDEGGGPYAAVPYAPRHPACTCTMIEVLK